MGKNFFSTLSKIDPKLESTWKRKFFLSLDIDWAHDEVIRDSLELIKRAQIQSTWFVTHQTSILSDLQQDSLIELGIHPNFNPLLEGESNRSSTKIINDCLSMVPNARSVRSHSLTQNERLIDQFKNAGLTHISNFFIPLECGMQIRPFCLWDFMIMVPHVWQDNVALKMNMRFPVISDLELGPLVLDFHPIHIYLNTENLERYERTRPFHKNPKELIKHRYSGYGTRNRLLELLNFAK